VPNTEGKAGMVAIVDEAGNLDFDQLSLGINKSLPVYARPLFLRVIKTPISLTGQLIFLYLSNISVITLLINFSGTFKMKKVDLQNEGYDFAKVGDDLLYFNDGSKFIPLDQELHEKITNGSKRL